ncbi:MAG: DMT family transporter [Betaproteobacteria bacterium]|nr:DMT family transporter [Betaproteobacteria bacterium]
MPDALLAWYFVIVWGSGFVATKAGLQYAAPFTFLSLRFAFGLLVLAPILWFVRPSWPRGRAAWWHIVFAGLLVHGVHLSGSHYGQYLGLSAGVVAIILASQPLLTALVAAIVLGERPNLRQWVGIAIGLAGVALVVWHKIDIAAMTVPSLCTVLIALFTLTIGTLYQRHFCRDTDLRSASFIQFAASLLLLAPLSLAVEGAHVQWSWTLAGSVAFLVIFASILAVSALHTLMRHGQATRVASMLYLPPVFAVAMEWLAYGVTPTALTVAGIIVTSIGVALAAGKAPMRG